MLIIAISRENRAEKKNRHFYYQIASMNQHGNAIESKIKFTVLQCALEAP